MKSYNAVFDTSSPIKLLFKSSIIWSKTNAGFLSAQPKGLYAFHANLMSLSKRVYFSSRLVSYALVFLHYDWLYFNLIYLESP